MLNIPMLQRVRDQIAAIPARHKSKSTDIEAFDMSRWVEPVRNDNGWCGTAMCIAGTALWLDAQDQLGSDTNPADLINYIDDILTMYSTKANALLGTEEIGSRLFYANYWPPMPDDVTGEKESALFLLDTLIQSGEIGFFALYNYYEDFE